MWVLMVVGKMVFCCGNWGICWGELIGGFGGVLRGYWVCCCVILGELLLGNGGILVIVFLVWYSSRFGIFLVFF